MINSSSFLITSRNVVLILNVFVILARTFPLVAWESMAQRVKDKEIPGADKNELF